MTFIDEYLNYISSIRRYSPRTLENYRRILTDFASFAFDGKKAENIPDKDFITSLKCPLIRSYEVFLMDKQGLCPRTVCQHLSCLSSFCKYLITKNLLDSNPVSATRRPRIAKRLPEFYTKEAMDNYFKDTECYASEEYLDMCTGTVYDDKLTRELYDKRLARVVISTLYSTGMRRAELIGLNAGNLDLSRKVMTVRGKGDKMREIPLVSSLIKEISLYLKSVGRLVRPIGKCSEDALFVTARGERLYPVAVDRIIKTELGTEEGIKGRKSPHVLRHSLATQLLDEGTDLYSIKELLGHSSLAATQIYTHASIDQLRKVYITAHPRAKKGGKYGD